MDIPAILLKGLGSVVSGGSLGVIGAIGAGIVDIYKTKETNKQALAVLAAQKELAITNGASATGLEMLKLIGGSYENDKAAYQDVKVFSVDWFRGTFRPFICWVLFGLSCWIVWTALTKVPLPEAFWGEIGIFSVMLCLNLMATCVSWWFGSRQMDKMRKK